jgi:hypothetical protein
MIRLLLSVSLAAFGATPYWIEPCTNPKTGCIASDVDFARWAMDAWAQASGGKLSFVETSKKEEALIRFVWASPESGLYGEAVPFVLNGHRGAQVNIRIVDPGGNDRLLRDTVVYLTCLHESGHAIGLPHTRDFADIMYSFQFGGDIDEYFDRYRRKLRTREDIRKNPGMSLADRAHLVDLFKN